MITGVENPNEYCPKHGLKKKGCAGCINDLIEKLEGPSSKDILDILRMLLETIQPEPSDRCPECETGIKYNVLKEGKLIERRCSICKYKFIID